MNERDFYAETYDASVSDWDAEIDFYQELAARATARGGRVLEIACGTGRVAIRLALAGAAVVGFDLSPAMLEVARRKSAGLTRVCWVQGDMRGFDLAGQFELIIIPGHSFQNLLTTGDQFATLECIRRHLQADGILVVHLDHQNVAWLGGLCGEQGGMHKEAERFVHPRTGREVHTSRAWWYEPATQTAIANTVWEEIGEDGLVAGRRETDPVRFHCMFRFEMEHLLGRAGYVIKALYGDFHRRELTDDSSEMIWVAGRSVGRDNGSIHGGMSRSL